jgi:hypothetical protein
MFNDPEDLYYSASSYPSSERRKEIKKAQEEGLRKKLAEYDRKALMRKQKGKNLQELPSSNK